VIGLGEHDLLIVQADATTGEQVVLGIHHDGTLGGVGGC
jgi:hypothetical protein